MPGSPNLVYRYLGPIGGTNQLDSSWYGITPLDSAELRFGHSTIDDLNNDNILLGGTTMVEPIPVFQTVKGTVRIRKPTGFGTTTVVQGGGGGDTIVAPNPRWED